MADPAKSAAHLAPAGKPAPRRDAPRGSLKGLTLLAYDTATGTVVQVTPEAVREVLAPPAPAAPDLTDDVPLESNAGFGLVTDHGQRLVGDVR